MASEASRKILLKMNILCANFFDKSAYKVRKISLGKIIGGGGARAPCAPPPVPTPMLFNVGNAFCVLAIR